MFSSALKNANATRAPSELHVFPDRNHEAIHGYGRCLRPPIKDNEACGWPANAARFMAGLGLLKTDDAAAAKTDRVEAKGKCSSAMFGLGANRRQRKPRPTPWAAGSSRAEDKYPNKTLCPHFAAIDPSQHAPGDVAIPLCNGYDSPWNAYVHVSTPLPISRAAGRQQARSALCTVDSGDSDLMILPWWGNTTETDLRRNGTGEFVVQAPYSLVCKQPVPDSWGKRSLLLRGPITVGPSLTFVSEFYQNIEAGYSGSDNVGNFAPGNAYTRGYGRGQSPIAFSGYEYLELDLRRGRPSVMTFSNRSGIREGYTMMSTADDCIMSVHATAVEVDDPHDPSKTYRHEFAGKGVHAYLDTGGEEFSVKTDPSFIKAKGWAACEDGNQPCNKNAPTGQGAGTVFFNTSFRLDVQGADGEASFTIEGKPLDSAWRTDDGESPSMDAGKHLENVMCGPEGFNAVSPSCVAPLLCPCRLIMRRWAQGGPTFEVQSMLVSTKEPLVGLKADDGI